MRAHNDQLADHAKNIDSTYPTMTNVILLLVGDEFTLALFLSACREELKVPTGAIFISCPDASFTLNLGHSRGMRIISHQ